MRGSPICPYVVSWKKKGLWAMLRRDLRIELLRGVSWTAMSRGVYTPRNDSRDGTSGFLGRVRLWLRLVFDVMFGRDVSVREVTRSDYIPPNRHKSRLRRRNLPLARRTDLLAVHMLRRYGRARFLNWIYNRLLTPRVSWCFRDWNWHWAARWVFASCDMRPQCDRICGAPLSPD